MTTAGPEPFVSERKSEIPSVHAKTEWVFPSLTQAQMQHVLTRGALRPVESGEVLIEQGASNVPFFVVASGELETVNPSTGKSVLVAVSSPGMFTGEVGTLTGRRALFRVLVTRSGEVIEITRQAMLGLIQTDAELGELLMRAFVFRRLELVVANIGDIVLIGSKHSSDTLRLEEFLSRNDHPYAFVDLDTDADVQDLMKRFGVTSADVPVVICHGKRAFKNPSLGDHFKPYQA
jgi:thioredoxin reductase (NADPH)